MTLDLQRRGLVRQATFDGLDRPVCFYVGFDPTADSLHVGHLIQLTTIKRLAAVGHRPIILIGDATARIGDPSGKRTARPMLSDDEIKSNANAIEFQIQQIVPDATFVRNRTWFEKVSFLEFARDIGSSFSVNVMLRAECFRARLEDGLSFLELSYMLMQAFDFLHLFDIHGCALQVGGDDQWSNILAGVDLIRRKHRKEALGLTLPLLVNADGTKMGKTEKGTVWLSHTRTSPADFFQFWRNLPDAKVQECFKLLSFLPIEEIESLSLDDPESKNQAKKRLAFELTVMVHGKMQAEKALAQAESVFEAGDLSALEVVSVANGTDILDALRVCGFAKSRTDARNLVLGRGVFLNSDLVENHTLKIDSAVFGTDLILRKGKKSLKRLRLTEG
jgi:tyrosyl-tRNA synthetase